MHRNNAGMIEIGNRASFGEICLGIFGLRDQLGVGNLDGNQPIQLLVVGHIDEAKAAFAQHFFDAIAANLFERLSGAASSGEMGFPWLSCVTSRGFESLKFAIGFLSKTCHCRHAWGCV